MEKSTGGRLRRSRWPVISRFVDRWQTSPEFHRQLVLRQVLTADIIASPIAALSINLLWRVVTACAMHGNYVLRREYAVS